MMNIPYSYPGNKMPAPIENSYNDSPDTKKQPFPQQMYSQPSGNASGSSSYNLGTDSSQLSAISSRMVGNGNMMIPSPLALAPQNGQGYQQTQQIRDGAQYAGGQQRMAQHYQPLLQSLQQQAKLQPETLRELKTPQSQGVQYGQQQQQQSQELHYPQPQQYQIQQTQQHQTHHNQRTQYQSQLQLPQQQQQSHLQPHVQQHQTQNASPGLRNQSLVQQNNQPMAPVSGQLHMRQPTQLPQGHNQIPKQTQLNQQTLQNHQVPHAQQTQQMPQQQQFSQFQRMQYGNPKLAEYSNKQQDGYYQGNPQLQAGNTMHNGQGSDQPIPNMAHESSGYQQALRELRAPTSGETKSQGQQDISQNQHQVTLLDDSRAEITPPVDATLSGTKSEIPQILTKIVASTDDGGAKKKRGRPKKLILDPETNQFIDSSHEHYKRLNKLLKERSATVKPSSLDSEVGKFIQKGTNFGSLDDQAVKQLLEQKDRRGRPRKFPIEQTGVTIKGIRVNGTLKVRKKSSTSTSPSPDQGIKKKRGRPKRDQSALS